METTSSVASGPGGKPLGTERLSALPTQVRLQGEATGKTFEQEVERASARTRGEGLRAERLSEQRAERRSRRHETFGREHSVRDEPRAVEAHFRDDDGPVDARAAVPVSSRQVVAEPTGPAPGVEGGAPSAPGGAQGADAPAPQAPPQPGVATTVPVASATPAVVPAAAEVALAGAAPRVEATALPALERAGSRTTAAPARAAAPQGPDSTMLERAEAILKQLRVHLHSGVKRLTLDLEPADLGRLSVQLALRAGKVSAIVRAESPETLALLEQRQGDLEQIFAERGIQADSLRFELGFGRSRGERRQPGRPGVQRAARAPQPHTSGQAPGSASPAGSLPGASPFLGPHGLDTYA